jgi:predicted nucleic acid-binding protein
VAEPGYVVDSNVFVMWFLPDPGHEHAREVREEFRAGTLPLVTTDVARYEIANILRRKGLLRGHLTVDEYLTAVRLLDDLGISVEPVDAEGLERAAQLAADHMISVFDALFVDLAIETTLPLLTGDVRLINAVANLIPTEVLRGVQ